MKPLVLTTTHNIGKGNKNLKHAHLIKLITTINCYNYLNAKVNLISQC